MEIKEVIIPAEKERIKDFLLGCGLKYERNIDTTLYIEEGGEIAATISASRRIIKCLAIAPKFRSENLAVVLVGEMIKRFHANGIYGYQVFTKPEYKEIFVSLGFTPLVETDAVAALEGGDENIQTHVKKLKVQIKFNLGLDEDKSNYDVASVVINGNPFTNGHLRLVEKAAMEHKSVLVFIVEEDDSYFTFKERYALAYLALQPYSNVLVLPSSRYIISKYTFPGYFLKTVDETTAEYAKYDAMLFEKYFLEGLGICKRYVGNETADYMQLYNDILKSVLKDKLEIVERFKEDGEVISASKVRQLVKEGKIDEAVKFLPQGIAAIFKGIVLSKQ